MAGNGAFELEHVVIDDDGAKPLDLALAEVSNELGIAITLTGGSGWGWSRYSTLQQCAYKYNLRYRKDLPRSGRKPRPLDIGACVHAFLAIYYQRMIDILSNRASLTPEPGTVCDKLLDCGASPIVVNESWRLFEAYANFWEQVGDYLTPLAVECRVEDPKDPVTCRYDLIADVAEHQTILPGTYIVEHKTASRMTRDTTEGWHLDGEILGQLALYHRAGLKKRYGALQGVIVNIITKGAVPTFHREIVVPPASQARRQLRDLRVHRGLLALYESTNTWPRSLSSCWGRYGPCEFWERCREGE